ncbi:MAG TPA: alanine racemase [Verrucomicrobiae bacterium]|nr:alanine racemase [Verrucomicrobiae bacterium]
MEFQRPVWAEIDLAAIAHNVSQVKNNTKSLVMAIVKANAYGHGAYPVAQAALRAGADRLGVAILAEALELRELGIRDPIMVLGYTPEHSANFVIENEIIQTVFTVSQAQALARAARNIGKKAIVHIKVDTGMSRIGFGWNKVDEIARVCAVKDIHVEGIFTHFAVADIQDKSFTHTQLERFLSCVNELESAGIHIPVKHAANSAAIIDMPEAHLDMVRPGIMIYGLAPSKEVNLTNYDLQPAMTLKAQIALVKELPVGETVSYGRTFKTQKTTQVATLPLGYADGYTRMLSGKSSALVRGVRAPVIGRICMDQCMLDVTDFPEVKAGDEVILFGRDKNHRLPVDDLADILGTINYEMVCMVAARVPRIYVGGFN